MEFKHALPDGQTLYVDITYQLTTQAASKGSTNITYSREVPHLQIHFFVEDKDGQEINDTRQWSEAAKALHVRTLQAFKNNGFKHCDAAVVENIHGVITFQGLEHPMHRVKNSLEDIGQLLLRKLQFKKSPVKEVPRFLADGMTDFKVRALKNEVRWAIVRAARQPNEAAQLGEELKAFIDEAPAMENISDQLVAKVNEASVSPYEVERISREALDLMDKALNSGKPQRRV